MQTQKEAIEAWVNMHEPCALPQKEPENTFAPRKVEGHYSNNLEILELIYQFWKNSGVTVVGDAKSAFSFFDESSGKIVTYSTGAECLESRVAPWAEEVSVAFEMMQKQGGVFFVRNGNVQCVVKGITVEGRSYEEAAARAMLMLISPES